MYIPWLAFGHEDEKSFQFSITKPDEIRSEKELHTIEEEALYNLKQRPVTWKKDDALLECEENSLEAEHILDVDFMLRAHDILLSEKLLVGIPNRCCLWVMSTKEDNDTIGGFGAMVSSGFYRAEASPISPALFVMKIGKIVGVFDDFAGVGKTIVARERENSNFSIKIKKSKNEETGKTEVHLLVGGSNLQELKLGIESCCVDVLNELFDNSVRDFEIIVHVDSEKTPGTQEFQDELEHFFNFFHEAIQEWMSKKRRITFGFSYDWVS
jgi:hypothetical protein